MAQMKKINLIPFRKNPLEYTEGETAMVIYDFLIKVLKKSAEEFNLDEYLDEELFMAYISRTPRLRIDPFLKSYSIPIEFYDEINSILPLSTLTDEAMSAAFWVISSIIGDDIFGIYNQTCGPIAKFRVIAAKYFDKWRKYYEYLINQQDAYNPLDDNSYTETRTGDNTDTTTYDITQGKIGTNRDTTTYDTETEDNGNAGTSETTTRTSDESNDIYGFNSASPVGDKTAKVETSETTTGSAEANTTHNQRTHKGTDTRDTTLDHTETKSGTDTKKFTVNETISRNGRNATGAELLQKELDFRSKNLFYNMVFDDMDRELCIQIY